MLEFVDVRNNLFDNFVSVDLVFVDHLVVVLTCNCRVRSRATVLC